MVLAIQPLLMLTMTNMSGFTQDGVGLVLHRGQHIKVAFLQITALNVLILFILATTFIPTIIIATTGTNTYVLVLKKLTSTTIAPVNFGFNQNYTTTEELKVINLDKLTLYSYRLRTGHIEEEYVNSHQKEKERERLI